MPLRGDMERRSDVVAQQTPPPALPDVPSVDGGPGRAIGVLVRRRADGDGRHRRRVAVVWVERTARRSRTALQDRGRGRSRGRSVLLDTPLPVHGPRRRRSRTDNQRLPVDGLRRHRRRRRRQRQRVPTSTGPCGSSLVRPGLSRPQHHGALEMFAIPLPMPPRGDMGPRSDVAAQQTFPPPLLDVPAVNGGPGRKIGVLVRRQADGGGRHVRQAAVSWAGRTARWSQTALHDRGCRHCRTRGDTHMSKCRSRSRPQPTPQPPYPSPLRDLALPLLLRHPPPLARSPPPASDSFNMRGHVRNWTVLRPALCGRPPVTSVSGHSNGTQQRSSSQSQSR